MSREWKLEGFRVNWASQFQAVGWGSKARKWGKEGEGAIQGKILHGVELWVGVLRYYDSVLWVVLYTRCAFAHTQLFVSCDILLGYKFSVFIFKFLIFLFLSGHIWFYIVTWTLNIITYIMYDQIWSFMTIYDQIPVIYLSQMIIYLCIWTYMITDSHIWSHVVVYDHICLVWSYIRHI